MRGRFTLIVVMIFQTHLDRVLVGEEVDDLKGVRDNADGHQLLAVVATLHHQADSAHQSVSTAFQHCAHGSDTYLSTKRSTMGICAFLNCFFAYRPAVCGR